MQQEYWTVPNIWEGGEAWIIGGGRSIRVMAGLEDNLSEEKLVEGVNNFLKPLLERKHIIGLNKAVLLGEWVDIVYFGDSRFLNWQREALKARRGWVVSCATGMEKFKWIKTLKRCANRGQGINFNWPRDQVGWFGNTGASAINLAAWLGAKTIYLLGFDGDYNKQDIVDNNWHKCYPVGYPTDLKSANRIYNGFRNSFRTIAESLRDTDVYVKNVTPNSQINDFMQMDFWEALG